MDNFIPDLFRFSIIMAAYNAEKTIARAIDSVINQSYCNYELIIVDDGSEDETQKIILDYQQILGERLTYIYQDNAKQGSARNAGFSCARGEYIIFIDSDDEMCNEVLTELNAEANRTPDSELIFFGYERVNEKGNLLKEFPVDISTVTGVNQDKFDKFRIPLSPCAHTARRDFLIRNNMVFLENVFFEDVDYMLSAISFAKSSSSVDVIGYRYYIYANSTVRGGAAQRNLDVAKSFDSLISKFVSKGYYVSELEYCAVLYLLIDSTIRIICSSSDKRERKRCFNLVRDYMDDHFPGYKTNAHLKTISFSKRCIMQLINYNCFNLLNVALRVLVK